MARSRASFARVLVTLTLLAAPVARAFQLSSSTLDGGGGTSSGGQFSLTGTIGQPDVGTASGGAYALQGGFWVGSAVPTSVEEGTPELPTVYRLYPNTPNPFNPTTSIRFDLPNPGRTKIRVFDTRGRLIRVLLDADLPAGRHRVIWDGRDRSGNDVSSGIYMLLVEADHFKARRKLTSLK